MLYLCIALSVILLLLLIVLLIDAVSAARTWLARIHFASLQDDKQWGEAVNAVCEKWAKHPPAVPLSDNTRLTIIERAKGTYSSKTLQAWQQAALCLDKQADSDAYKAILNRWLDPKTGDWRSFNPRPDSALLAYALLTAPGADAQHLAPAMKRMADYLLKDAGEGTVRYNPNIPAIRFVDTVGMVCGFLVAYDRIYGCPAASTLACRQMKEYMEQGLHEQLFLPVHCFNKETGMPLGIYGWGRGMGWLALGVATGLLQAKDQQTSEVFSEAAQTLCPALTAQQTANGGWRAMAGTGGGAESSATAMLGWSLLQIYKVTGEKSCLESACLAKNCLKNLTRRDGTVDLAQGDTKGIGMYSAKLAPMPAAQGFAAALYTDLEHISSNS